MIYIINFKIVWFEDMGYIMLLKMILYQFISILIELKSDITWKKYGFNYTENGNKNKNYEKHFFESEIIDA